MYCNVHSLKLSEDNIKSVERAKLELVRLDQQLQVAMDEYSKVRELNQRLTNKMQLEKAVSGEAEQSLKASVCVSVCICGCVCLSGSNACVCVCVCLSVCLWFCLSV